MYMYMKIAHHIHVAKVVVEKEIKKIQTQQTTPQKTQTNNQTQNE